MAFINPYTFVGFPKGTEPTKDVVVRRAPLGHAPTRAEAQQRYTGTLTVQWALRSPLAIPADGAWGLGSTDKHRTSVQGELHIPGSSVKGAVRSVHEALFGGCARVVDLDFAPIYREMMTTELRTNWTLALVIRGEDDEQVQRGHKAIDVSPCSQVDWIEGEGLKSAWTANPDNASHPLPRTGDLVKPTKELTIAHRENTFASTSFSARPGRDSVATWHQVAAKNGLSVLLVTDTSARPTDWPYYWAAGRLSREVVAVSKQGLSSFRNKLRGADSKDSDTLFQATPSPPASTHQQAGPHVAQRRSRDGKLLSGDVIWVRLENNEVVDIKLSLGWRRIANSMTKDRLPRGAAPCGHVEDGLCLTCSIFGSADSEADEDQNPNRPDTGRQGSYGSHVRFGPITGTCTNAETAVSLAPLASPHPGAGMYYLAPITPENMSDHLKKSYPNLDPPPSNWDSPAGEIKGRRMLRGRKFYWHSDPEAQMRAKDLKAERFRPPPGAHDQMLSEAHVVFAATLSQRITFDGLDALSLATLLAALQPGIVLGEGGYALHLGRGKPLGLGSVSAKVALEMTTTAERYQEDAPTLTTCPALDKGVVAERCGDLTAVWKQANKVMAVDGLGAHAVDVSYPTVLPWTAYKSNGKFHESYEFFSQKSGMAYKKDGTYHRREWEPLPEPTDLKLTQGGEL